MAAKRGRRFRNWRLIPGFLALFIFLIAIAYETRYGWADDLSEFSRGVIGNDATLKWEGWLLTVEDVLGQTRFRLLGGSGDPFAARVNSDEVAIGRFDDDGVTAWEGIIEWPEPGVIPPKPSPVPLPEFQPLRADLIDGEGVWTEGGLPRPSGDEPLMVQTFVRPDPSRNAMVGVLLLDKRRIRLHVAPSGAVPAEHRASLLAVWNGGFQFQHASWGAVIERKQFKPLRAGYASLVIAEDGTIKLGKWGRDLSWTEDTLTVRQGGALLVDNCEVNAQTSGADPNLWGRVAPDDTVSFITARSAVGLTANGDLLIAAGTNLSAATLAKGLWSAGACWAMQLDINASWVIVSLIFQEPDGSLTAQKFMPRTMVPDARKFLKPQDRDFMYVTLDETNYGP